MVDFLCALIKLFSLAITVPELWGEMCTARLFSQGVDLFALKFYLDSRPPQWVTQWWRPHTACLCIPSFWWYRSVMDRRTDRQICHSITVLPKLALRRAIKTSELPIRSLTQISVKIYFWLHWNILFSCTWV